MDSRSIWMGRSEPRDANGLAGIVAGDGCPPGREPLIATVLRLLCPDEGFQSPLFRDRAVSTLLKIEIEMDGGFLGVAGSEMANQDSGLREVGVESRRL